MYTADEKRYDTMRYNRCGRSGLKLLLYRLVYGTISVIFHRMTT